MAQTGKGSEPAQLTEDFEWEQSIRSFAASSDRARYIMFIVVFATFIAMFGWDNARDNGWMSERAANARLALDNKLWAADCAKLADPELATACRWSQQRKLDEKALKELAPKLADLDLQHGYYLHLPIVDVTFDVNDLGMASGLGFAFIMLTLFLSMVREHENLYLCLWRVKEKFYQGGETPNDGWSRANLFYHSLAMAQVFSNPPTLGRWQRNVHDHLPSVIFFLPLLPQFLILREDVRTRPFGDVLDPRTTRISLGTQVLCIAVVLALAVLCWLYSRSCERKWRRCFALLNPAFARLPAASWWSWLELPTSLHRGRPAPDGALRQSDGTRARLSAQLAAARAKARAEGRGDGMTAILFESPTLLSWSGPELEVRLAELSCSQVLTVGLREGAPSSRLVGSRRLLRRWRARELALAVIDGEGIIQHLDWRADVVRASALRESAAPAARAAVQRGAHRTVRPALAERGAAAGG